MAETLPVLALKNTVVYPQIVLPLAVGRAKSLAAIKAASERGQQLLTVAQRAEDDDDPAREGLHDVGALVTLTRVEKRDQGLQVIVQGLQRVRLGAESVSDAYLDLPYTVLPELRFDTEAPEHAEATALLRENLQLAQRIAQLFDSDNGTQIYQQLVGSISQPDHPDVSHCLIGQRGDHRASSRRCWSADSPAAI